MDVDCSLNPNKCLRPPKNISFFINVVLHMFILLVIISSFFFFYVTRLTTDKFQQELDDIITTNLPPAIVNADKQKLLKIALSTINMDRVVEYYKNKTDKATTIQNKWLIRVTLVAIVSLLFTIILTIVILKFSCQQRAPFFHIIKENIILFFFVGIIEITFFLQIARYFVPTQPSLMMKSLIDALKANFRPN